MSKSDKKFWVVLLGISTIIAIVSMFAVGGQDEDKEQVIEPVPTMSVTTSSETADDSNHDDPYKGANLNEDTGTVVVSYGDESTFFNETALVEGMFGSFVKWGEDMFTRDEVKNLRVVVRNKLTDSYGNENVENVALIEMTKEEFNKYDWENLKYTPIYFQMLRSASELYIHPVLLKEITLDELRFR